MWVFPSTNQQNNDPSGKPLQQKIAKTSIKMELTILPPKRMELITINKAVMDSLIHRCSSRRWPMTIQAQRSATKRFNETTEAWSEVDTDSILDVKEVKREASSIVIFFLPLFKKSELNISYLSGPSMPKQLLHHTFTPNKKQISESLKKKKK